MSADPPEARSGRPSQLAASHHPPSITPGSSLGCGAGSIRVLPSTPRSARGSSSAFATSTIRSPSLAASSGATPSTRSRVRGRRDVQLRPLSISLGEEHARGACGSLLRERSRRALRCMLALVGGELPQLSDAHVALPAVLILAEAHCPLTSAGGLRNHGRGLAEVRPVRGPRSVPLPWVAVSAGDLIEGKRA